MSGEAIEPCPANLIFEPHNGFGGVDPDGVPWPLGYISAGIGQPIFELSTIFSPDEFDYHAIAKGLVSAWNNRPLAAHAEQMAKALADISRHAENPNINHADYRIEAKIAADKAITEYRE
jgi:hypothetical protein